MTRQQILLIIAMEECNEVAQRISKALRFTLEEVQPDQLKTNDERIVEEFNDLCAVIEVIQHTGILRQSEERQRFEIEAKKIKIEKYLKYSEEVGTLGNEARYLNKIIEVINFANPMQHLAALKAIHALCKEGLE